MLPGATDAQHCSLLCGRWGCSRALVETRSRVPARVPCADCPLIQVWDFWTGSPLFVLEGHTNRVFRVQFDERKIVSSSQDDKICVWDFTPRELVDTVRC